MLSMLRSALHDLILPEEPAEAADGSTADVIDEEALFCKNNICGVFLDDDGECIHIRGYLTVLEQRFHGSKRLCFKWISNVFLQNRVNERCCSTGYAGDSNIDLHTSCPFIRSEKNRLDGAGVETLLDEMTVTHQTMFARTLDLRSVKIFFTDSTFSQGELVLLSKRSSFRTFRFHFEGLVKLTEILRSRHDLWYDSSNAFKDCLTVIFWAQQGSSMETTNDVQTEGFRRYQPINLSVFRTYTNDVGQVEQVNRFREHVFFGGFSDDMRREGWKFLLGYYPLSSTYSQREKLRADKASEYLAIHEKRFQLTGEEYQQFWKKVQFVVERDVIRTDRSNPFYAGQDNPNLQTIRNILLNYAFYNPAMGYTQGMSDIVALLFYIIQDEAETFWCFVHLVEQSVIVTSPTDLEMEEVLTYLRCLLELLNPEFYDYYSRLDPEISMIFIHRWLILCYRREFEDKDVMRIWESCWSFFHTKYFHLFICLAIINIKGRKCITTAMSFDDMLNYFTSSGTKMHGVEVFELAQRLMLAFFRRPTVPCTLKPLLRCPSLWFRTVNPATRCVKNDLCRCGWAGGGRLRTRSVLSTPEGDSMASVAGTIASSVVENGAEPGTS